MRTARYLGLLLVGWVFSWLVLGLTQADPLLLLRPNAPETLRIAYIALLYLWLITATTYAWRRWGPRWVRVGHLQQYALWLALGIVFTLIHRAILGLFGWWTPPQPAPGLLGIALVTCPILAWSEEFVFRGYLYGVAREELGRGRALVAVNAFFALVHLFRPGTLAFKAMFGVGLWLAGVLLSRLLERFGLAAAAGLHTSWILAGVLDPPGRVTPGWFSGLGGDPAAGFLGWLLLASLVMWVRRSDD